MLRLTTTTYIWKRSVRKVEWIVIWFILYIMKYWRVDHCATLSKVVNCKLSLLFYHSKEEEKKKGEIHVLIKEISFFFFLQGALSFFFSQKANFGEKDEVNIWKSKAWHFRKVNNMHTMNRHFTCLCCSPKDNMYFNFL